MKVQRIHRIEAYVRQKGAASIKELCAEFYVSKNTIRRDLKHLLETGDFEKVYGGIALKEDTLISFENRQVSQQSQKKLISKKAASLIDDGDLIFVDSGTTTKYLIDYVPKEYQLTVVTNNLDVINVCSERENIELIIVGSKFKSATRSFIEFNNHDIIKDLNIRKAFMAATGISIQNGLTNSDMLETMIKKSICQKSDLIYLLADESKFDRSTLITYSPLNHLDALVSGGEVPKKYKTYLKENDIDLHLAY
ncbi:DeoR/GlpR transcriptional regulator [Vagococcus fluvialis]|uniref:DeoR/GlpR family DNA-binding transcription regulator n=1 Tax=Vagococcus fluvialis TaxID=2738 RepID=UPI000A32D890|nr:DeoR/GlpR family DNA-binding transcription regulator [Vagococcus fluvialis]MBO0418656.1 DeoR/GlpR transcriptional regulator [Vagococcus fluvialis]OTP31379.1 hypothetical protein A5798_001401 [Enterococcus sp. 6C8_DIV0013]